MKLFFKFGLITFLLSCCVTAFASNAQQNTMQPNMLSSAQAITNLTAGLQAVKSKTNLSVIFPKKVPAPVNGQQYYFSFDQSSSNSQYILNVDSTPTCNGMKGCNIGTLVARLNGSVTPTANNSGQTAVTKIITLKNGQTAYFMPPHAGADFWPATLQWKNGNVAYYLSWNTAPGMNAKKIMVMMANSAIQY